MHPFNIHVGFGSLSHCLITDCLVYFLTATHSQKRAQMLSYDFHLLFVSKLRHVISDFDSLKCSRCAVTK